MHPHWRWRRQLLATALGLTVVLSACGPSAAPDAPQPSMTPADDPSTTPSETQAGPSQDVAAATRDGVVPEVAALPFDLRVDPVQTIDTAEGRWVASRPTPAADQLADGCRLGQADGRYPTDFVCTWEYGEILLLDATGSRILRAYPLPSIPATVLAVNDDAVFCGRSGELPMTDGMLCRIDRDTLQATVRVFPDPNGSTTMQPCFFAPGNWSFADEYLGVEGLHVDGQGLWAQSPDGTWTQLDPVTLTITARGASDPSAR